MLKKAFLTLKSKERSVFHSHLVSFLHPLSIVYGGSTFSFSSSSFIPFIYLYFMILKVFFFKFLNLIFIVRERAHVHNSRGGEKGERNRERKKSQAGSVTAQSLMQDFNS